jgi:hypothetical protein
VGDAPRKLRGPYGTAKSEWFTQLLQTPTRAHLKVAAFLVARLDARARVTHLTRSYISRCLGMSRTTLQRALTVLESEGLFLIDRPSDEQAGARVSFALPEPVDASGGQFAKVYKSDTAASWFRNAPSGVLKTWIAHLRFLSDQRFGRVHFASHTTIAKVSGQTKRAVRDHTRWLEERGVLVRQPNRFPGSNTTVFSSAARLRSLGGAQRLPSLVRHAPPEIVDEHKPEGWATVGLNSVVEQAVRDIEAGRSQTAWIHWEGSVVNVAQLPITRAWLFLGERPRRGPSSRAPCRAEDPCVSQSDPG